MKDYGRTNKRSNRDIPGRSLFRGIYDWLRGRLQTAQTRFSPRRILLLSLALVLGGALACQVIWQHVRSSRMQYKISKLEHKNHDLRMKVQKKQIVVARLERLDRIQRIALSELGMQSLDDVPTMEMSRERWVRSSRKGGETVKP